MADAVKKVSRQLDVGPTGRIVAANIKAVRLSQHMTINDVSLLLGTANWPINAASLSRIESCARRVDVDDLMALATVLQVTPLTLLLPLAPLPDDRYTFTGFGFMAGGGYAPEGPTARKLWQWAKGIRPMMGRIDSSEEFIREHALQDFRRRTSPIWPIEVPE